jgi:hypothetical protein
MTDVHSFSAEQRSFLKMLLSDFKGPTSSATLLYILANVLDELKPDWRTEKIFSDAQLQADVEVCEAAIKYLEIQSAVEDN